MNRILLGCRSNFLAKNCRFLHYVQGQSPKPGIREYFYFIDHQGQLFLDDVKIKNFTSCFKEKKFLAFFFSRLKQNDSGRFEDEFPFFSPCGREKNYIKCDDRPIVFTKIIQTKEVGQPDLLSYGGAEELLTIPFCPEKVCMLPHTGRIYHPSPLQTSRIGLIKSSLAIEISKSFDFDGKDEDQPPTHFTWRGQRHRLTNELYQVLLEEENECD